ncbi:MAG: hypothetical protein FGM57_02870 [Candidatus Taylorbacteria bacterium]|nr:hypothetical protein [Candidatus Taylorbacteria bacterium]
MNNSQKGSLGAGDAPVLSAYAAKRKRRIREGVEISSQKPGTDFDPFSRVVHHLEYYLFFRIHKDDGPQILCINQGAGEEAGNFDLPFWKNKTTGFSDSMRRVSRALQLLQLVTSVPGTRVHPEFTLLQSGELDMGRTSVAESDHVCGYNIGSTKLCYEDPVDPLGWSWSVELFKKSCTMRWLEVRKIQSWTLLPTSRYVLEHLCDPLYQLFGRYESSRGFLGHIEGLYQRIRV